MPTGQIPADDSGGVSRRGLLCLAAAAAALAAALPAVPALARAVAGPVDVSLPPDSYPRLFGTAELALGSPLQYFPQSKTLIEALARPVSGAAGLAGWNALLDGLAGAAAAAQLDGVNRFVNEVRYVGDRRHWGVADRWTAPAEFFAEGGDCEDFAVAKFVSLHRLGFNPGRLRFVLAHDERKVQDHGFLVVYLGPEAFVLDNQIEAVTPHEAISHYRPLCSFNDRRLWLHRS